MKIRPPFTSRPFRQEGRQLAKSSALTNSIHIFSFIYFIISFYLIIFLSISLIAMGYSIGYWKISIFFSCKRKKKAMEEELKESLLVDKKSFVVPKGCLAVYVGDGMRRFVIPTNYLCLPTFRALMERVGEEFGFDQIGGLRIPCEEDYFIGLLEKSKGTKASKNKLPNIL